jgi:hypothetical protein
LLLKRKTLTFWYAQSVGIQTSHSLQLGMYPVSDPQAVRNPRPDANSYLTSGLGPDGTESGGSRIFQWGFAPVGGARANADGLTPNNLALGITLGTVTVSTT